MGHQGNSHSPNQHIRHSTTDFLVFTTGKDGSDIEVRYEDGTIWLTQKLMAELFGVDVRTISEHLGNIYASDELTQTATLRKFRIVRIEGGRQVN